MIFDESYLMILLILFCVGVCRSQIDPPNEELCLPLRHSSFSTQPVQSNQGRPGKVGPVGPPGPKGNSGEPGICGCNPSEVEQLNSTIGILTERLELLSEKFQSFISPLPLDYFITNCAVGFRDGRVQNSDITASSIYNGNHAAHQGRLDYVRPSYSYSWSSRSNRASEWIQVDLKRPTHVTGVITQGRGDADQWVTSFKISYSDDGNSFETLVNEAGNDIVFQGNSDRNTYVLNRFPRPITARYFRLIVQSWRQYISMRMEYITC